MKIELPKFKFKGGVHPRYCKERTADSPVRRLPRQERLLVPLSMHLGAPAKPVVKAGDKLLKNQLIAEPNGFLSVPVYAPEGGTVKAISEARTASGAICQAIEIEVDAESGSVNMPALDWKTASGADLLKRVEEAGIAGMGGAGFPTRIKLAPAKPVDTLIINGAECEPYLTSDHRLMVEKADGIRTGIEIIRKILGIDCVRILIEDNKPDAIMAMERAFGDVEGDVGIVKLKTVYPQGSEKQQIYSATGREVPSGALPMDVGCVVDNVGTAYAIYDAVVNGHPLTRRVVTVTGDAVTEPANFLVPFGVSYRTLIEAAGGFAKPPVKVVSGGPMMGFTVADLDLPVGKTSSGVTCLSAATVAQYSSSPCISCGRCVDACPMRLIPSELSRLIEAEDVEGAKDLHLMDCIECGSCAYVCPAHRALVHHYRRAKGVLRALAAREKGAK